VPKLRTTSDKNFTAKVFNKSCSFVNLKNEPTYVQSRVSRILTKEPETIEWIGSMSKNSVFFDIGANIGIYTISAGLLGIQTYAFEPHAGNYFLLCQNINTNNFKNVTAYCVGLGQDTNFSHINIKNYHPGVADNVIDQEGQFNHGVVQQTLDDVVLLLKQPTHIKIDVDGYESNVLNGATETLKKATSVLFEISDQHLHIVDKMLSFGYKVKGKYKRNEKENNYIFSK
jgi:FkbM family methyltransferase|tara:strand:+ start:3134 stop:3820 length:687 start_codon:yes stop_codon:yes gene_type:complete